ncbi:unnamed protein product [Oikopleura dioica]|uniref:Uncharacterized protein n=1 Tax=Oikopleura dioica TaxID=34765 RepID=E4XEA8_OIKDI|nr:unnamed protein product [Oikopleura dioica]
MLWHRVSTFQHYLAYLRVRDLWSEIKKTKKKRSEKSSRPPPEKFSTVFNQDSFVSHKERRYIRSLWRGAIKAANNKTERRRSTQLETLVGFIRSSKAHKMPSPVIEESSETSASSEIPEFNRKPRAAIFKEPEVIPDIVHSDEDSRDQSLESSDASVTEEENHEVSISGVKIPRPEIIRTSDETTSNSSIGSLGRHVGTLRRMEITDERKLRKKGEKKS